MLLWSLPLNFSHLKETKKRYPGWVLSPLHGWSDEVTLLNVDNQQYIFFHCQCCAYVGVLIGFVVIEWRTQLRPQLSINSQSNENLIKSYIYLIENSITRHPLSNVWNASISMRHS
jgi:hypothetical protein